jgi:hypothetical protein
MTSKDLLLPFFRWCFAEVERDNEEDFAFVRRFEDAGADIFLQFINRLDKVQRKEFSMARLRWDYVRTIETPPMEISAKDAEWLESYSKFIRQPEILRDAVSVMLGVQNKPPLTQVSFRNDILSGPASRLKECEIQRNRSNLWLDYKYRGMNVHIVIDIGGNPMSLSPFFGLNADDGTRLIEGTDPLAWRNICRVQWYCPAIDDGPRIVNLVAASLERFISAVDYVMDNMS